MAKAGGIDPTRSNQISSISPASGARLETPRAPYRMGPVLERNPEAMKLDPLPGYVWLDTREKVLHAAAQHLEIVTSEGRPPEMPLHHRH